MQSSVPEENPQQRARAPLFQLPAIAARRDTPLRPPAEVRSAADLPDRLFVGDLVPESFEITPGGWRARYEDAEPETWAELAFERGERPRLRVSATWRGLQGPFSQMPASGFGELARAALVLPPAWLDALRARLAGVEAEIPAVHGETAFVGTFPDGWLMQVVVPVPARDLPRIGEFHRRIAEDPDRSTAVRAMLRPWWSFIEYAVGRSAVAEETPEAVAEQIADAWGLPVTEAPEFVDHPGGPRVLRAIRRHFNLEVTTSFRDFERALRALVESGLVVPRRGEDAPERRALAAQAPLLERCDRVEFYALDRSLRIVHLPPAAEDCIEPSRTIQRAGDLDAFLRDVAHEARAQRVRVRGARGA
jgi:hypothetical protein